MTTPTNAGQTTLTEHQGKAAASRFMHEPAPWILGGCSGRMITTPSGYVGDGFIADVDTLANAKVIAQAPAMYDILAELDNLYKASQFATDLTSIMERVSKVLDKATK